MSTESELISFYQNYYDAGNFSADNWKQRTKGYFSKYKDVTQQAFVAGHSNTLNYYRLNAGTGGRFLDIGCGLGKMIFIARKCNWEVYGTEFDGDALEFVRQHIPDAQLYLGDFIHAGYPDNYFDYVLLYHVIEHVTDPVKVVNELKRIIKPGGILFIGTPNIGNVGYRAYRIANFLRGRIPGIVDGMEHTFLFTKKRLAHLLQAHFQIITHKAEGHTERLSSILASDDPVRKKFTRTIQLFLKVNQRIVCRKKEVKSTGQNNADASTVNMQRQKSTVVGQ